MESNQVLAGNLSYRFLNICCNQWSVWAGSEEFWGRVLSDSFVEFFYGYGFSALTSNVAALVKAGLASRLWGEIVLGTDQRRLQKTSSAPAECLTARHKLLP